MNNNLQNDRFSKLFKKANSSFQKRVSTTHTQIAQSSTDSSFYAQPVGLSQKPIRPSISPYRAKSTQLLPTDENSVLSVLFSIQQVLINRQKHILKTQFLPTSNGMRYILVVNQNFYLNLSWIHSVQELEKNKILLLYYQINEILSLRTPKIQTLIIQFHKEIQMLRMLKAIKFIHAKTHDQEVEKLYHLFC